jgi:formate dehydrogenase major subunit
MVTPFSARSTDTRWDGKPVNGFTALTLKGDGPTACGCWIYCGCLKEGVSQTARRKPFWEQSWVAPEWREWAWSWPNNRRRLYNRA